jgi:hypothetical protein
MANKSYTLIPYHLRDHKIQSYSEISLQKNEKCHFGFLKTLGVKVL